MILQFHAGGIAERLAMTPGVLACLFRWACRGIDAAIVMTTFGSRDPEALGITDVRIIPHQIEDENPTGQVPRYAPGKRIILYAGHLHGPKGTPALIEAFAQIAPAYPEARLVLMGEFLHPYPEAECRTRIQELTLTDRVELCGVKRGQEKADRYRDAHLFVFPSLAASESFGLVMIEAMMWGLPILATDWRGNREVVQDAGVCCPASGDLAQNLALLLQQMLASDEALAQTAQASRRRFEKCFRSNPRHTPYRNLATEFVAQEKRRPEDAGAIPPTRLP
jgi:glycosyltransferase involved in cell wall biosynthesis